LAATVLLPVSAIAQTPTLQQDVTALNLRIARLQNLPKLAKSFAAMIVGLKTASSNRVLLKSPPSPSSSGCQGTPIVAPAVGAIIMPPVVPRSQTSADVVGVKLQNTGSARSPAYVTFGQVFRQGQMLPTDGLSGGQLDALALWSDGSVKMAAVTMASNLCAGSETPLMLTKAAPSGSPLAMPAVALTVAIGATTVDFGAALKASTDFWLRGPLATQARVDVPVPGQPTMHITADMTAFADGSVLADVQFNNDLTSIATVINPPALRPIVYTPTITLNSKVTTFAPVTQYQFQNWHVRVESASQINVQHDLVYPGRS
jgi:hypothetical protein